MHRRASWLWRVVFGVALLAVAAFIAFDVLDLDGSQLLAQPAEGPLLSDAERGEADAIGSPPDLLRAAALLMAVVLAADRFRLARAAVCARVGQPRSSLRARAHLTHARLVSPSSASDPA